MMFLAAFFGCLAAMVLVGAALVVWLCYLTGDGPDWGRPGRGR